jgi:hypothetical protein
MTGHEFARKLLLSVTTVSALAACGETGNEAEVVMFGADYPTYSSVEQLGAAADLVVEVELTGETRTILIEPVAPEDPNDPRQNPLAGAPPQDTNAPEAPPIVATAYEAVVTNVVEGSAAVGERIEIQELGGTYRGVEYVAEDSTPFQEDESYLVFLSAEQELPAQTLNPDEAKFIESGGEYVPLPTNETPVTTEQLEEYLAE